MKPELDNLVDALRLEMTQYGELLALMQEQQELIINRSAQELLKNLQKVNSQMQQIADARAVREKCRLALASTVGGGKEISFRDMSQRLPSEYQPLLGALVGEINHLLSNVQKWLRQNHLLLRRSIDLMQHIVQQLFPDATTRTYSRGGMVTPVTPPPSSLYEGII